MRHSDQDGRLMAAQAVQNESGLMENGAVATSIALLGTEAPGRPATAAHRVITGTAIYASLCWIFDYPLYGWMLWTLGPILGGSVMILLSIPFDLLTYKFYDWSREDWFAIEHVKSLKHYTGRNPINRMIGWILRETPVFVQVPILSLKFNSFVVSAFMRDGAYAFQGLSPRDWRIFWWSFIVGQVYWIIVLSGGMELAWWIYQRVRWFAV